MLYKGSFKDINDKEYDIEIMSGNVSRQVDIIFGSSPVIITGASEGIFSPIKSRSCSIEIVSTEYYMDLYDPKSRGTSVKVTDLSNNKIIFKGFLTPCEYNQTYSNLDTITLEAIDGISTSKDFKWVNDGNYKSFFDILLPIIKRCGYRGFLYVPDVYTKINGSDIDSDLLKMLYASSANFVDDNEEKTPWSEYEVVGEICKFLGFSLVPDGEDVYLIDYRSIHNGSTTYRRYNIQDYEYEDTVSIDEEYNISEILAPGTPSISIDDIYNKIEISDNLYKIEDISPDIDEEKNHISITREKGFGVDEVQWWKYKTSGWLWWKKTSAEITGYDYQTICRFKPGTGWKHRFYKKSDLSELDNENGMGYYDPNSSSIYNIGKVNTYCNTLGCLFQHYAHRKEEGINNLPASIDWMDILTFFITDDSTPNFRANLCSKFELPVLEYTIDEMINWKPSTGKSWITLKGDLFYQYDGAKYGEKNRDTLNIVNKEKRFYTTVPVDKSIDIDEQKYTNCFRTRSGQPDTFGLGFRCWKMKLQIGDKFWSETWDEVNKKYVGEWVDYETTFYIRYNNSPGVDDEEFISAFKWMSMVNNNDYKDKVGVDGYCIPIDSEKMNDPSFGRLKLTIYTPSLIPEDIIEMFQNLFGNSWMDVNWTDLPPVIYCKDFEIGYVYTNSDVWYMSSEDNDKNDKVYIGKINDNYVQDFDGLEFKLNTVLEDKPISRSYVSLSNGYLRTLKHKNSDSEKEEEYNIIDMYLDHYSDRKVIYDCNIHGLYSPSTRFEYDYLDGDFVIDRQSYDLKNDNNNIKIISF